MCCPPMSAAGAVSFEHWPRPGDSNPAPWRAAHRCLHDLQVPVEAFRFAAGSGVGRNTVSRCPRYWPATGSAPRNRIWVSHVVEAMRPGAGEFDRPRGSTPADSHNRQCIEERAPPPSSRPCAARSVGPRIAGPRRVMRRYALQNDPLNTIHGSVRHRLTRHGRDRRKQRRASPPVHRLHMVHSSVVGRL